MRVSSDMPDDVIVLHDALTRLREFSRKSKVERQKTPLTLHLKNCGTALRFLQVHLAQCYPGEPITLTGDKRLMERDGKPTSQTTSARILHGEDIPITPDESPYVGMTRKVMANGEWRKAKVERDWSSAAFWYEYVAIHGGELLLEGLIDESLQGDRVVADIYAAHFGVETEFTTEGAVIKANGEWRKANVSVDFKNCPDLYPAVALTCEKLGIALDATGTERLRYKESDRLEAVRLHEVRNDHRIAMAMMAADYPVSEEDQACIAKSYPTFAEQFSIFNFQFSISHITPIKGVNDDGLGKKHALSKLIRAARSEYVWLHDDDVILPLAVHPTPYTLHSTLYTLHPTPYDLIILPLRMESENEHPSLLERLQIAEYAAIQELTIRTARQGRAVMCSGANLLARREAWLACEPDLHPEIPSGDDMFLLEAMKRRGMRVGVLDEEAYTAVVRPMTTWRAFWRQRMRWAGKAPHYSDRDIRRCGAWIVAANILQVLCPPVLLVKFPIEYSLIKRRSATTPWAVALLLEAVYPFYMLGTLIGGLRHPKRW